MAARDCFSRGVGLLGVLQTDTVLLGSFEHNQLHPLQMTECIPRLLLFRSSNADLWLDKHH